MNFSAGLSVFSHYHIQGICINNMLALAGTMNIDGWKTLNLYRVCHKNIDSSILTNLDLSFCNNYQKYKVSISAPKKNKKIPD